MPSAIELRHESSLSRNSLNAILERRKLDVSAALMCESTVGRKAEMGPGWQPSGVVTRKIVGEMYKRSNSTPGVTKGNCDALRVNPWPPTRMLWCHAAYGPKYAAFLSEDVKPYENAPSLGARRPQTASGGRRLAGSAVSGSGTEAGSPLQRRAFARPFSAPANPQRASSNASLIVAPPEPYTAAACPKVPTLLLGRALKKGRPSGDFHRNGDGVWQGTVRSLTTQSSLSLPA